MGSLKKNYVFKGLDTRTNKLYRKEGTASDCRNVRLDSTRKLVKVNDMSTNIIPRGSEGETGEFLDRLPFLAKIIDIMPYEDHFVIATTIREEELATFYKDVNKFYKWFEDTNTVEFIPFEKETYPSSLHGQLVYKNDSDIDGGLTYLNQEDILYFSGSKYPEHTLVDFSFNQTNSDNDLSSIFTYDGKVIGRSGCPSNYVDTTEDEGTLGNDEYVRLLPFKIDDLGRHTFGNYSTHRATQQNFANGDSYEDFTVDPSDESYDHNAFLKLSDQYGIDLDAADSALDRTVDVEFYTRGGIYKSAAKGQYMYGIKYSYLAQNVDTGPPTGADSRSIRETYEFYRCTIEETDYIGNTAQLGEFKKYSNDSGLWEDSSDFKHTGDTGNVTGERPNFLSNIIYSMYGSADATFGYKLRGFVNIPYGLGSHTIKYATSNGYANSFPLTGPVDIDYPNSDIFLYISQDLDDIVDLATVKLPAPKVRHLINYLGAIVCVDHKSLYFSDFSLGGSIEVFTPFDTFNFGSSKRGPVTGVFANETYLVGFREQEAYYITGNIFTANYRIQSFKSTRIGCTDPRSIIDFQGAGVFASERGIFVALQGGAMQELSDSIENIFTDNELELDLDQFNVKAVIDFKREYLYLAIESTTSSQDSYILAYSYYHQEWFIYDHISAVGGFDIFNNKLYASDGTNLYIEADTSVNTSAFYRSNFETLGVPSFEKKFLQALMFAIDSTQAHTIDVKTYKNWNTEDAVTEESKDLESGQVDMTQRFDPSRSKSVALEIASSTGQQLILNGYELEVEADVEMFKNDD